MFQHPASELKSITTGKNEDPRFVLPGYGRPLDFAPVEKNIYGVECRSMFPSALDDRDIQKGYTELPVQTLREIDMVRVMEDFTDIPEWWKKIYDPGIADDWKKIALNSDADITPNMANWIIDELKFKAIIYEMSQAVGLYNGDITKSDTNIPESLRERLRKETKILEYTDPELVFSLPGTSGKQRNLLPQALYPLVYGKSRILPNKFIRLDEALQHSGQGEVIGKPSETGITREDMTWRVAGRSDIQVRPYSRNFQALPFDLEFGDDSRWNIVSYINNLHPVKHRNIYKVMEDAFNCMVPQFNMTMAPLKDQLHSRARIEYHKAEYHPISKEALNIEPQIRPNEAQSEFEERYESWRDEHFKAIQPDVGNFIPWAVPPALVTTLPQDLPSAVRIEREVNLNKDYKERGLQVIPQLLSAHLTPEDPYFEAGWHVEGQMNEHVCASAFFTYESENVEDPIIEFRNLVETMTLGEVEHELHDYIWLKQVFGLVNGEPPIQCPASIKCTLGRTVIYPSIVQHRFTHIELKDKSKPGFIRGLVFHLVDPNIRIISTANIPPQRLDWTLDSKSDDEENLKATMASLALDNKDKKGAMPMSLTEALDFQDQFLEEMVEFTKYQHVAFESPVLML